MLGLIDTGDPLRWSAARIEQALGGIREELTAEALVAIDEITPGYKQKVLDNPVYWADDEDD